MANDTGSVVTVEGPVPSADIGLTLPHEHIFIDLTEAWFDLPASAHERSLAREEVSLDNLWYIRRNPLDNRHNGRLESIEQAITELSQYYRAGGDTLVDVTPKNTGSDPKRVRAVSRATGLTVVHGTAYYTRPAHPAHVDTSSIETLAAEFESDVLEGIGDTDVRAGIVGEIGLSERIHEQEEKVLRAGARAAVRTGAPLTVHPPGRTPESHQNGTYPTSRWALDILDIVEEEGLSPNRVIFSHMDRSRLELEQESLEYQREVADRGAYLEYDLWGTELFLEKYDNGWPSDPERMQAVLALLNDGYADRLLFSHDVCMKIQLREYGGFGYSHLPENILPTLERRGVTQETLEQITIENPRTVLQFEAPDN